MKPTNLEESQSHKTTQPKANRMSMENLIESKKSSENFAQIHTFNQPATTAFYYIINRPNVAQIYKKKQLFIDKFRRESAHKHRSQTKYSNRQ